MSKEERFKTFSDFYKAPFLITGSFPRLGTITEEATQTHGETSVTTDFTINGVPVRGTIVKTYERPSLGELWGINLFGSQTVISYKVEFTASDKDLKVDGPDLRHAELKIGKAPSTLEEHLAAVESAQDALAAFASAEKARQAQEIDNLKGMVKYRDDQLSSRPGHVGDLQDAAQVALKVLSQHESYRDSELESELRTKAIKRVRHLQEYIDAFDHDSDYDED